MLCFVEKEMLVGMGFCVFFFFFLSKMKMIYHFIIVKRVRFEICCKENFYMAYHYHGGKAGVRILEPKINKMGIEFYPTCMVSIFLREGVEIYCSLKNFHLLASLIGHSLILSLDLP